MVDAELEYYYNTIPIGKENAIEYYELCSRWGRVRRSVRAILHELSLYDNGDNYILIRSGGTKGFYKTDDPEEIAAYRQECLNKGRSVFAPVKKCNRILKTDARQFELFNNLRAMREAAGLKQKTVCKHMRMLDKSFDVSMLSRMENGCCLPTPKQLAKLAEIYGCGTSELIRTELYQ